MGRQSVLGLAYPVVVEPAVQGLPKELCLKWFYQAETIRALNQKNYELSRELTEKFSEQGARTAILKGQANSRLYPDKFVRQTGDVDLWVEGGRERVVDLLSRMGLLENVQFSRHEVTLPTSAFGIDVEVHFDCIYDCRNPFANRRLKRVLAEELQKNELVPEGFYVPTNKFALLMQLSHIRKHFIGLGVGLRQLVDYFVLLRSASVAERAEVSALLKPLGLAHFAAAVMWILSEKLGLQSDCLLCAPDANRGRVLLREVFADGNFGKFSERKRGSVYLWWLRNRLRVFGLLRFDFAEVSWHLLKYWASFLGLMPERLGALRHTRKGAPRDTRIIRRRR